MHVAAVPTFPQDVSTNTSLTLLLARRRVDVDVHGSLGQSANEHLLIGAGVFLGAEHAAQNPVGPVDVVTMQRQTERVNGGVDEHLAVVAVQRAALDSVAVDTRHQCTVSRDSSISCAYATALIHVQYSHSLRCFAYSLASAQ